MRQILVPGDHHVKGSYHFANYDIRQRDRNMIPREDILQRVGRVWAEVEKEDAIREYIYQAKLSLERGHVPLEFQVPFKPRHPEKWVNVFREIFGDKVAIRDVGSMDFNLVHQNEYMGLQMVTFPSAVYETLMSCRDGSGNKIANYQDTLAEANKITVIQKSQHTTDETAILDFLKNRIHPLITGRNDGNVVLFEPAGTHEALALCGDPIKINRKVLSMGLPFTVHAYIHEVTHNETGANDADAAFRDYLSLACAKLALLNLDSRGIKPVSMPHQQPMP